MIIKLTDWCLKQNIYQKVKEIDSIDLTFVVNGIRHSYVLSDIIPKHIRDKHGEVHSFEAKLNIWDKNKFPCCDPMNFTFIRPMVSFNDEDGPLTHEQLEALHSIFKCPVCKRDWNRIHNRFVTWEIDPKKLKNIELE